LSGFRLARADLRDINLNRGGSKEGYDLSKADLYRADLRGAHLFQANLTDASLMKAHLEEANLNHSILRGANLLGVVLGNAKTEHADWGQKIRQHHEADAARAAANGPLKYRAARRRRRFIEICANNRKAPVILKQRAHSSSLR
jgi:hypothetical protein